MALYSRKQLLLQLFLIIVIAAHAASETNPNCTRKCGSLDIPYPFGTSKGCYLDQSLFINCTHNDSGTPIPFLGQSDSDVIVLNISLDGKLTVSSPIARWCEGDRDGVLIDFIDFLASPDDNKFVTTGCNMFGKFVGYDSQNGNFSVGGCVSSCDGLVDDTTNDGKSCSGIRWCQTQIPKGQSMFQLEVNRLDPDSLVDAPNFPAPAPAPAPSSGDTPRTCGYAFIAEASYHDFTDMDLFNRSKVVLDWTVGEHDCGEACKGRESECVKSPKEVGYLCRCKSGFRGDPYRHGGCTEHSRETVIILSIALSVLSVLLVLTGGSFYLYSTSRERRLIKIKEKIFRQNGGILLQQQIARHNGSTKQTAIFTAEELKKATNNYDEARVTGKGGHGTVYKGVLSDGRVIAIKKSRISDQSEIEQFINEVVVLSQINHRNVVKLIGCCLETEVPLLVYEFVTNGTLSDHIHVEGQAPKLPWPIRLRVATEAAEALGYLHSAASTPIIHRDIKTSNILLDLDLTAKVSDFGASKLVPLDKTQLTTLVQGTLGYLDPEYFQTSQLTEKSDVYSFGVVLAELLTSKKAISFVRNESERNLSMFFVSSMREGRLQEILDKDIVNDANVGQIIEVANLAKRCLMLKGEERPTMKEVTLELEGLRIVEKISIGAPSVSGEETEYSLNVPVPCNIVDSGDNSSIVSGCHSMQNQILESLGKGR